MKGIFHEKAYGDLEIFEDASQVLHLRYYSLLRELKVTPEVDSYTIEIDGLNVPVQFLRDGGEIVSVQVLFEPSVSPIQFTSN